MTQKDEQDRRIRFGDYFGTPGSRVLAVFAALLVGGGTGLFMGWQIGVLIGACTALVVSVLLPFLLYRADVPYEAIKKTINGSFLFDERVRFNVRGGRTVGGFFILTEQSMVFLSIEQGRHRMELAREDVKSIVLEEETYSIKIFLNDTQFIQVISGVCFEMYSVLQENRWR